MTQSPGPPEPDDAQPPPETRQNDDRESIWSIPASLKKLYFGLFTAQVTIAAIWLAQAAIADPSLQGIQAKILHLWQNLAPAAISSATLSLILTDAWKTTMVLGSWLEDELKKRRQRQINAAVSKAVAEAETRAKESAKSVDEAVAEARAEERAKALAELQKWETWNRKREAAAAEGKEFNEPPPSRPSPNPEPPNQQP